MTNLDQELNREFGGSAPTRLIVRRAERRAIELLREECPHGTLPSVEIGFRTNPKKLSYIGGNARGVESSGSVELHLIFTGAMDPDLHRSLWFSKSIDYPPPNFYAFCSETSIRQAYEKVKPRIDRAVADMHRRAETASQVSAASEATRAFLRICNAISFDGSPVSAFIAPIERLSNLMQFGALACYESRNEAACYSGLINATRSWVVRKEATTPTP